MALANLTAPLTGLLNSTLNAHTPLQQVICSEFYGAFDYAIDCTRAIDKLPDGFIEIPYTINHDSSPQHLPMYKQSGNCMVQIEMAGQRIPSTVILVPDKLKRMATRVLGTCVKQTSYIGGFVTGDLYGVKQWITAPEGDLDKPMPYSTSFITVSLSTPQPEYISPGDYDPVMASIFSSFEFDAAKAFAADSSMAKLLRARGRRLLRQFEVMTPRGRRIPWWGDPGRASRLGQQGAEGNATAGGVLVRPGRYDGGGTARRKRISAGRQDGSA
ncbi:MAG: hypothetical protein Q9181_006225 [Wetmoreana brouardii]